MATSVEGSNALTGTFPLPLLLVKAEELEHNIQLMADWCAARGLSLAPHAKTTMAPAIVERQLAAGAWGITVASPTQALLLRAEVGFDRLLIANEVVDAGSLRGLAELVAEQTMEVYCLVDSHAGIELLEDALRGVDGQLNVMIEVGFDGGRAGCRHCEDAVALAARVGRSAAFRLVGLEAFEGIVPGADRNEMGAAVDALMLRISGLAARLDAAGAFADTDEILLSAGGSALFDHVADTLSSVRLAKPVRIVLRSGCYVTHDHGFYEKVSPLGELAAGSARFLPALELWASVISRPERDLVVLGFGKRDISYDIDLPRVIGVLRDGRVEREGTTTIITLHDQHAVARTANADLRVGDVVQVGMSHPCTSFDKWRSIPLVAPDYAVLDIVHTRFR